MTTNTPQAPPLNQLPERVKEAAQHATDAAKQAVHQATDAVKDGAQHATDAAKDMCHTMSIKLEDTMVRTKEYVRQNPVPVVLGALAFGAALGYMVVMARREEPTFRERYVDEPLHSARDAIYAAFAPVARRIHDEYDSARDGAGKAMDRLHRYHPSRTVDSWSDQLRRVSSNLKFW